MFEKLKISHTCKKQIKVSWLSRRRPSFCLLIIWCRQWRDIWWYNQHMGHGDPGVGKMIFCRERFEIYFLERNPFFKISWKYHLLPTVRSTDKNHWWKLRFGTESASVYNLSQWWLSSVVYIGISRPEWVKLWNCIGIYLLNMEFKVLVVLQLHWVVLTYTNRPTSSWWLQMAWCQIGTRPSTITMLV